MEQVITYKNGIKDKFILNNAEIDLICKGFISLKTKWAGRIAD